MKIKRYSIIISLFVIISLSSVIFQIKLSSSDQNRDLGDQSTFYDINNDEQLSLSSQSNNDLINTIFNSKLLDYYDSGYFHQVYEPSLQATYYALYILNAIGKLNQINQTKILEYIMAHYNPISNRFMDKLAYRYLDTDFSKTIPRCL